MIDVDLGGIQAVLSNQPAKRDSAEPSQIRSDVARLGCTMSRDDSVAPGERKRP